jgi:ABC-2 type transport system permease protein
MEFRVDFFFRIVMDLVYYGINIAFFKVLYSHTDVLGGWNESQIMVFVAVYLLVDAIYMTVFSSNMWWLPTLINKGDLDYYLVRPVNSIFMLSLREFAANSFVNLLMAVGIMVWALWQYTEPFDGFQLILLALLTCNGTILYYLLHMVFVIPVFWTHSGRGLGAVYITMAQFIERPDRLFSGAARFILLTVLPFSLMASFPAKLFLDGFDWLVLGHVLAVTVGFMFIVQILWRLGLNAYSSASS